jgi:hypothetical protein
MAKVVIALALLVAAYAAWVWGPRIFPDLRVWMGIAPASAPEGPGPSPELADSVLAELQGFRNVGEGQIALGGREVTSVLRYSLPGLVPSGIRDPEVSLRDGRVHLSAQVVLSSFPDLPDLGPVLGILPDTLEVVLHASLMPFGPEESALLVIPEVPFQWQDSSSWTTKSPSATLSDRFSNTKVIRFEWPVTGRRASRW